MKEKKRIYVPYVLDVDIEDSSVYDEFSDDYSMESDDYVGSIEKYGNVGGVRLC